MKTWNEAAIQAVDDIFLTRVVGVQTLIDARKFLDKFIQDAQNDSVQDAALNWRIFGATSLGAGQTAKVIPHRASPEFRGYSSAMAGTLIRKQKDYGPDAIMRFGTIGILVRTHDKVARLENLKKKEEDPLNESVKDGYLDLLGYAALGMILERGQFPLPMV